jgi:hypothetical protein
VTLTVGDGLTTDVRTITNAITVTGGSSLPYNEAFEGGFPPPGWSSQGSGGIGGQGGQGGLQWQADATGSCAQGISAHVNAYSFSGTFAAPPSSPHRRSRSSRSPIHTSGSVGAMRRKAPM